MRIASFLKFRLIALIARYPPLSRLLFDRVFRSGRVPHRPNEFVAQSIRGCTPGKALDVTMGDGRNAVYLATQGWDVTGFDISAQGLEKARDLAARAGVKLTMIESTAEDFDYGRERWDLIVCCYAWAPISDSRFLRRVKEGLRVDGLLVFTHFLRDAANPIPKSVGVTDPGELRRLFAGFEIVKYEEMMALPDWQPPGTKREPQALVQMVARKGGDFVGC